MSCHGRIFAYNIRPWSCVWSVAATTAAVTSLNKFERQKQTMNEWLK